MLPKKHIILGAFFFLLVWILFPKIGFSGSLIIFASSVLIDVDHYIYYIIKKRNLSLSKAYKWYLKNKNVLIKMNKNQRKEIYSGLCFLHGIEAIAILFLLTVLFPMQKVTLFILIGFIFHEITDAIGLYTSDYRLDKVISFAYSLYS